MAEAAMSKAGYAAAESSTHVRLSMTSISEVGSKITV
jgi:hypothetical protein